MAALFVAEEWDRAGSPMSVLNCQLASCTAEERETHCMVLRVHDEKERGQHNKVNLNTPCLHKYVEHFDVKNADINWLLSPEMYFTQVSQLKDVQTIVGHFPTTSTAALAMKDRFFQTARVILINHGIQSTLAKNHLKEGQKADVVFSVGQQTYDDYSHCYKGHNIDHKLYLPRPDKGYFDLDIDVGREEIPKKQILTSTVGSKIDYEFNRILASAIGDVVALFYSNNQKLPSWHVRTCIPLDCDVIRAKLNDYSGCGRITPTIHPSYGCQGEFCTELLQSYLCIIPPDESCGMQGLESIAAGLPVLAPMRSSVGDLITVLCPLFASCLLFDSNSKDDLSKKITDALSRPKIAAERAKELKKQYQENCKVSTTHQDFLSHFVTSATAMTSALSRDSANPSCSLSDQKESQYLSQKTEKNTEFPIGITSPGAQSPQSGEGISSDGSQPLPLSLEEDTAIKAEVLYKIEEKKVKLEKEKVELENRKKIEEMAEKHYNMLTQLILSGDPQADIKIKQLDAAFEKYRAILEKPVKGSLLFPLSYLSVEDMEYFWQRYKSCEVEETLTGILISPEIQSMAEEEGFTVRIVLKIDEKEFNEVKQKKKVMKTLQRSPAYDNWERYVLDHIPNIHHARYLIDQSRFDPVMNTLRQEEFFYPTFVSYWYQNMYSLQSSVTKATQYAIMHHVKIYCKEHNLNQDRLWAILQGRFERIGKILFDNISDNTIGKLYTSWIGRDVSDIKLYLYGLGKECEDCFTFCNSFVYTYIIACYLAADIRSGGKCLPQLLDKNMLKFYDNKVPYCYPYVSGILRDKAGMFLKEYSKHLWMEKRDVYLSLERLGYFLLEISCSSVLAAELEQIVGKQTLDLSNCKPLSNKAIHAFASIIRNTSIIKKVVLYSDKEKTSFSEKFKAYVENILSEPRSTNKICCEIRNSHEFISLVKLLRALPILFCCAGKSEPLCRDDCYTLDIQSVVVNASALIGSVDECFVEILFQALEWMPMLERLDLVNIGLVCSNILQCILKVKPKLSIAKLSLAENELSFQHCEMILKVVMTIPNLKCLDLKSNNIGSVGCSILIPVKDDVQVIVDGNGAGKGLADILSMVCITSDQVDLQQISAAEIRTLVDFHKLQRSLECVTKLNANLVPLDGFYSFCDNLSLFIKIKHLVLQKERHELGVKESELLQASLKRFQVITHLDIEEIEFDMHILNCILRSIKPSLTHLSICHCNVSEEVFTGSSERQTIFSPLECFSFIEYLSLSHNHISDHGARGLSKSIASMFNMRHLDLSHNMIGDPGVECLSRSMERMHSLTHFNMGHNYICDYGAECLSHGMDKMEKIKHLDLSHNNIGDHGIQSFGQIMQGMVALGYIDFSHNDISGRGAEGFMKGINFHNNIRHLDLSHNKIGDDDAEELGQTRRMFLQVAYLDFSYNNISDRGTEGLSQWLQSMYCVKHLDLSHNRIGDRGAECLSRSNMLFKSLTHFDISHNYIADHGAEKLSQMMDTMKHMTHIDLSHNRISDHGIERLSRIGAMNESVHIDLSHNEVTVHGAENWSEVLEVMDNLVHLNLSHYKIGDSGAERLGSRIGSANKLTHLILSDNDISDIGVERLSQGMDRLYNVTLIDLSFNKIGDTGAEYLRKGMGKMNSLMCFDLSHNCISDLGADSLSRGISKMHHITRFNLSHNKIGDIGAKRIGQSMQGMDKLAYLDISHNDIGATGAEGLNVELCNTRHLDLGYNKLGDLGAERIGQKMQWGRTKEYLDLSDNDIGDHGAKGLSKGMASIVSVKHLDLRNNKIGDPGALCLAYTIIECHEETKRASSSRVCYFVAPRRIVNEIEYLDLSYNYISDLGAKGLSKAIKLMYNIRHLYLSHNKIGDPGAECLSRIIGTMDTLTNFDLSHNCIGDYGAENFSQRLDTIKNTTHLDLSHNRIDDHIVESLSRVRTRNESAHIDCSHNEVTVYKAENWSEVLEVMDDLVNLSHCKIGDSGAERLGSRIGSANKLTHLILSDNDISDIGVERLSQGMDRLYNVTLIDLSFNKIGDTGAEYVGRGMGKMAKLMYLDFSHNCIRDLGAESLSKVMSQMYHITHLNISYNKIGDRGAERIGLSMPVMSELAYLDLSHNDISARGAEGLSKGMKSIANVRHLDLSHNTIGDHGVACLAEKMSGTEGMHKHYAMLFSRERDTSMNTIEYLDLSNNDISDRGAEGLSEIIQLMHETCIRHLDLSHNKIGDHGAESLGRMLWNIHKLTYLNISHNKIGDHGAESLGRVLWWVDKLTYLNISHNVLSDSGAKKFMEEIKSLSNLLHINLK